MTRDEVKSLEPRELLAFIQRKDHPIAEVRRMLYEFAAEVERHGTEREQDQRSPFDDRRHELDWAVRIHDYLEEVGA